MPKVTQINFFFFNFTVPRVRLVYLTVVSSPLDTTDSLIPGWLEETT